MKQICILTGEQAEELRNIKEKIYDDAYIIAELLKDQPIKNNVKDETWEILERIQQHCDNMEYILCVE